MPELTVQHIDPLTDPRWDPFVEQHPLGWLSHTSAWARVLVGGFRHFRLCYLGLVDKKGGQLVAGLPLCEVRSRLTGVRLVSLPLTTLCDPLVTDRDQLTTLTAAAKGMLSTGGARFLEIRGRRTGAFLPAASLARAADFKYHSLDLEPSLEEIKRSFHRKSIRPCIHRAERSNLKCLRAETRSDLVRFYGVYSATRKGLSLPPMPYRFFDMMWRELFPKNMDLLLAESDRGEPAAALILLRFGTGVSAEASGWDRRFAGDRANHFILWEAIRLAKKAGYQTFDFGRTPAENLQLNEFKRRWGTEESDLPFGYYPAEAAASAHPTGPVRNFAQIVCRFAPMPVARAFGDFCYRHSS